MKIIRCSVPALVIFAVLIRQGLGLSLPLSTKAVKRDGYDDQLSLMNKSAAEKYLAYLHDDKSSSLMQPLWDKMLQARPIHFSYRGDGDYTGAEIDPYRRLADIFNLDKNRKEFSEWEAHRGPLYSNVVISNPILVATMLKQVLDEIAWSYFRMHPQNI